MKNAVVKERGRRLAAGFDCWKQDHEESGREFPKLPYIMLHSLSHLLITAMALECGYPAGSICERIYAEAPHYGILLYTGSTDAMYLDVRREPGDGAPAAEIAGRFTRRFVDHDWPGRRLPGVLYDPRFLDQDPSRRASLHAKGVVVDSERSFVSSANFTEAAQLRNIEVGVVIRSRPFAEQLIQQFQGLAAEGLLGPLPPPA